MTRQEALTKARQAAAQYVSDTHELADNFVENFRYGCTEHDVFLLLPKHRDYSTAMMTS